MRRLFKLSLLVVSLVIAAHAQSATPQAPLPPAMQNAIDHLAKGPSASERQLTWQETRVNSFSEVCSVALTEVRVDHPERYTMRTVPVPPSPAYKMPRAQMPAPPCEQSTQSAPLPSSGH